MKENHVQTTKTARYFTLGKLDEHTQEVWIVLHGYAQLAKDFIALFDVLNNGKNFIIAPEALNRFYAKGFGGSPTASWMTSEDRQNEIADYIHYLDTVFASLKLHQTKAKIIVLGFSQGVATASRWIHATQHRADYFIVYSGEIARELLEPISPKIKSLPITYITGTKDKLISKEKQENVYTLMNTLQAKIITFDGGHEVLSEVLNNIKIQE
jgi:predicted esterase